MDNPSFRVEIELLDNYVFQVNFGEFGDLVTDEPEPLGSGEGPNPTRLLAASVGNCLAASLLFAIRKFHEEPGKVTARVEGEVERRDKRWRVVKLEVRLQLGNQAVEIPHLQRALDQFEDFCVVTQSVRAGIPVDVVVEDSDGREVKPGHED